MKKSAVLKFFAVICLLSFIVACNENTIRKASEVEDVKIREKVKAIVYDTNIKELKNNKLIGEDIPAVLVDIVGLKKKDDTYYVFAYIFEIAYEYDRGFFSNDFGGEKIVRYDMDLDFDIVKVHQALDGGAFMESMEKMTEKDKKLIEKLMGSQDSFSSKHDIIMEDLKKNAEIAGLKNFSYKKNEIPGYEKDVREIDDDTPDGVICIIKNKDYDKAQEERKEIVPSGVAGKHTVYAPCIWYHEKTGICVKNKVWYDN